MSNFEKKKLVLSLLRRMMTYQKLKFFKIEKKNTLTIACKT